jgi:hypothetical protein
MVIVAFLFKILKKLVKIRFGFFDFVVSGEKKKAACVFRKLGQFPAFEEGYIVQVFTEDSISQKVH